MNSLTLFFRSIKASVRQNPVVYIVFVLFYIFSTVVCIYIIGKYGSTRIQNSAYEDGLTTFKVSVGSDGVRLSELSGGINGVSQDDNVEYVLARCVWEDSDEAACFYPTGEKEKTEELFQKTGIPFADIDAFLDSDNAVIVKTYSDAAPQSVTLQGKEYEVFASYPAGKADFYRNFMSYKTAQKSDPLIFGIEIKYRNISGYPELDKIKSELNGLFPGANISEPVERDYNLESIFSLGNILVYLVALLSAVNFIYIFYYILSQRRTMLTVYRLCGCSEKKLLLFSMGEILLISAAASGVGVLCFELLAKPLLTAAEPLLKYAFAGELYLAVFTGSVIISLIALTAEYIYQAAKEAMR